MIDIYAEVTNRIIDQLEKGVIPWQKPWIGIGSNAAVSWAKGTPYSILNQILLGKPGEYITFKQCNQAGGKVKKGTKSRLIVFWKMLEKPVMDENGKSAIGKDGQPKSQLIPFLEYYNVFHINDCEGIKPRHEARMSDVMHPVESAERVIGNYVTRYNIGFKHEQGDRSYYRPSTDSVTIPLMEQFKSIAEYYSTAFHELTHSTGHVSRLNRLEKAMFGSEIYSKEELVAEIGAASLMHEMGFETEETFQNSVAYIQSWLKALRNDKKMIVAAAGKAEKAAKMILEA